MYLFLNYKFGKSLDSVSVQIDIYKDQKKSSTDRNKCALLGYKSKMYPQ